MGIMMPEISKMQTRAIIEAAIKASQEGIKVMPEIMVPLVGMASEMRAQKELIAAVLEEVGAQLEGVGGHAEVAVREVNRGAVGREVLG